MSEIRESAAIPSARQILRDLVSDNETAARTIRAALSTARTAGDETTIGLLAARLADYEKQLWMARSMAGS